MQGGIIDKDMPIDVSNVAIVCPKCGKPTRVGYRIEPDGNKVRVCRKANGDAADEQRDHRSRRARPRAQAALQRRGSRRSSRTSSARQHHAGPAASRRSCSTWASARRSQQPSLLEGAVADLAIITGQKPIVTKAKKSIASFKLREGNAIGVKVTLARRPHVGVLRSLISLGDAPHP